MVGPVGVIASPQLSRTVGGVGVTASSAQAIVDPLSAGFSGALNTHGISIYPVDAVTGGSRYIVGVGYGAFAVDIGSAHGRSGRSDRIAAAIQDGRRCACYCLIGTGG